MSVTVGDRAGSKLTGQPGAPRHTERDTLLERDESPGPWTKPHLALGSGGEGCQARGETLLELPVQFLQHGPVLERVEEIYMERYRSC